MATEDVNGRHRPGPGGLRVRTDPVYVRRRRAVAAGVGVLLLVLVVWLAVWLAGRDEADAAGGQDAPGVAAPAPAPGVETSDGDAATGW